MFDLHLSLLRVRLLYCLHGNLQLWREYEVDVYLLIQHVQILTKLSQADTIIGEQHGFRPMKAR